MDNVNEQMFQRVDITYETEFRTYEKQDFYEPRLKRIDNNSIGHIIVDLYPESIENLDEILQSLHDKFAPVSEITNVSNPTYLNWRNLP